MVTNVENKLMKSTIIVDISILGFIAHCMLQRVSKGCSFAICIENMLCISYQLATFFTIWTEIVIFFFYAWTVRRLCVTLTNLGQRKHNELIVCALLVPSVRLPWSDVLLASTLTREKTLTFLNMQKMCAEVDAHINE